MAFGKGSNRTNNNVKNVFSFKIKVKDLPAPHFEVKKKEGDKWVVQAEPATRVSGNITAIQVKENRYQNEVIRSVGITLQDGEDLYFVDLSLNSVGRSIMNNLCSLKTFENVEISLYQSKPKEEGGKTYASGGVTQNDTRVTWFYSLDQLPKVIKVPFKGKEITDTTNIDNFFLEKMTELGKAVKASHGAPVAPEQPTTSAPKQTQQKAETADDEEVPF